MSKNPSEKDKKPGETEAYKDERREEHSDDQGRRRQAEATRRHNAKQKFVSDEDIKRRPA
jgi:hypothetical protein